MYLQDISFSLGIPLWLLAVILIWSMAWKLFSLWIAARNNSKVWFIILALVNTVGILEIIYIFAVSKCCMKPARNLKRKKTHKR